MKPYQTSFFDESKRLAALSRLGDPLEQLSTRIQLLKGGLKNSNLFYSM